MSIHDEGPTTGTAAHSDPNPFPNLRQRRRRGLYITTAAAVALGLAVGGGAVANAAGSGSTTPSSTPGAPGGHHGFDGTPPAAFGTVASVGSDTFTLTTHDGTTVTVDVSSTTTYVDPAVTTPTLADVKVGSHVAVFGTDASNTVTATKVAIGAPDGTGGPDGKGGPGGFDGTPPAAFGTVASVGTNTFTLTTRDNTTVTVDVSPSTTYMERGVTTASIANVTVGTRVVVFGTDTSNTVTATKVGIGGPSGGPGGPGDGDGPASAPSGTSANTSGTSTGSSVTA